LRKAQVIVHGLESAGVLVLVSRVLVLGWVFVSAERVAVSGCGLRRTVILGRSFMSPVQRREGKRAEEARGGCLGLVVGSGSSSCTTVDLVKGCKLGSGTTGNMFCSVLVWPFWAAGDRLGALGWPLVIIRMVGGFISSRFSPDPES
jgi:hypothetical protein